ncbi:MAG: glyoxylate/hydroxypyruvate reductase A [Rhodospirillaceae bacterium]|nr:MAG: glyoxylate/hydroxypyruvate reductase A [Rhodospirillaceae bacterium]
MTTTSNRRLHFAGIYDRNPSWRSVFAEKAPEIAIASPEEAAADPASIRYCLAWRPKPGELAALPNLQVVFGLGAGVDGILADATIPAHLPIVRMVEQGLTKGMVEYVLWQVLYHHRRVWELEEAQANGVWLDHSYPAPWDRAVGIMGLGEIGAAAAERLADFKFKLRGWSRNRKSLRNVESFAGAEELPAFLKGCDILVCLLPLTVETRGLLNADLFAHLPRGAALINAGRGAQLNEADFLAALQDGQIGSATLDVFQTEPLPPNHPFWQQKRLFITPHNASMTEAGAAVLAIRQQILDFEAGQPLRHLVDRQAGY